MTLISLSTKNIIGRFGCIRLANTRFDGIAGLIGQFRIAHAAGVSSTQSPGRANALGWRRASVTAGGDRVGRL
jgi:hypothetical protein